MTALTLSDRQIAARAAAAATASLADLSTGTGPVRLRFYTAPRRAAVADIVGDAVLLCIVDLTDPPGTVVGADLVLTQAEDALILATGDPEWATLVDGNGDACADMSAGPAPTDPADPAPVVLINQPTLYAGGYLRLAPMIITG